VAVGAGAVGGAGFLVPQYLAIEHPQRRRIDSIVVLHGLAVAAEIGIAGATLVERNICGVGRSRDGKRDHCGHGRAVAQRA